MSEQQKMVIFLDTNVLIQCYELKDLPWKDISDGKDLLLLVPRAVQEEIDRQKSEGNTRRGKRARKVSSSLREIILSEDSSLVLCDSSPGAEISFPDNPSTEQAPPKELDLSRADDRIIFEMLRYVSAYPNVKVQLLTHDTNPMLTCKRLGLNFMAVPDPWLLPPEPDTKDKRIQNLERKIKELEKTGPTVEISAHDVNKNIVESITMELVKYEPLTEEQVTRYVEEIKARSPLKTNFDDQKEKAASPIDNIFKSHTASVMGLIREYKAPTEEEIKFYTETEYPIWLEGVETKLKKIPKQLSLSHKYIDIRFELVNNGAVPAENLVVEFESVGGFVFMQTEQKEDILGKTNHEIPKPPSPPEGKWITKRSPIMDMLNGPGSSLSAIRSVDTHFPELHDLHIHNKNRDRHRFYWKQGKQKVFSNKWIFECEEFRHKVEREVFELTIYVPSEEITNGGINCLVTAKNLPVPYEKFIPISVNYSQGSFSVGVNKVMGPTIYIEKNDS